MTDRMIPANYVIAERQHWLINHRIGSTYSGYLMVASKQNVDEVRKLCADALREMGEVLAEVEHALHAAYKPYKVIFSKLGFTPGFNCHFHMAPVYYWVLEEIKSHPNYSNEPDGNDAMLYINREYCENQYPERSAQIASQAIAALSKYLY